MSVKMLERIKILEQTVMMLRQMKTQIVFKREPITILLENIVNGENYNKLTYINDVIDKMNAGFDFFDAWKKSINTFIKISALRRDDEYLLISFASNFGQSDAQGQAAECDACINLLEMRIEALKSKAENGIKIYNMLGILSGIFIAIILF